MLKMHWNKKNDKEGVHHLKKSNLLIIETKIHIKWIAEKVLVNIPADSLYS